MKMSCNKITIKTLYLKLNVPLGSRRAAYFLEQPNLNCYVLENNTKSYVL